LEIPSLPPRGEGKGERGEGRGERVRGRGNKDFLSL